MKEMAEPICRVLRDGALEGEHAPALMIKDSMHSAFGLDVFNHILCSLASNISAGKSQARGLVLVSLNRHPSFYTDLLKSRGIGVASSNKLIQIVDCYSDPLGWKDRLLDPGCITKLSPKATGTLCKDIRDLDKLLSVILELGNGLVGVGQGKIHFSVAIDLVTVIIRHTSLQSVSRLISNLRSHDQVSSVFWLIHSDLHEMKAIAALEYMSSMVANLEPIGQSPNEQRGHFEKLLWTEQNSNKGKFHVRFKRRNGRVKLMSEEFLVEQGGIKFITVSSGNGMIDQSLLPKVQFNLQLSEKERVDRAKVVLPFEHQGNGKSMQIYDGRRSLTEGHNNLSTPASTTTKIHTEADCGKGEIHYIRDSDDEMPDSDEDPDDDLDI